MIISSDHLVPFRLRGDYSMNPNSIVAIGCGIGQRSAFGMGFAITGKHVATAGYVVEPLDQMTPKELVENSSPLRMALPLVSSSKGLSGRVVGRHQLSTVPSHSVAIIEICSGDDDVLTPAKLINARDNSLYFDRKIRILGYSNKGIEHVRDVNYFTGTLQGLLPNGLIQFEYSSRMGKGSGGTPIWDIEASAVIGMLAEIDFEDRIGFMIPISSLSEAWPGLENVSMISSTENPPKPKIFLCHAHEDQDAAQELFNRLKDFGYDPWMDKECLLPGQNWDFEIRKAIKNTDFFLVLLSARSVEKRGYVQKEFKIAIDNLMEIPEGQIYLLPVKLDDCLVPSQFSTYQWVELHGESGFERIQKAIDFQISVNTRS
jgi:hypothetical protein